MNEAKFWSDLEWRICREFAGMADDHLRYYWCDGLAPHSWRLEEAAPRIVGTAWIGDDVNPGEWGFTLFLPGAVGLLEEIDWAALLPAENVTQWLAVDLERKRIQIEPGAAVPDSA